VTTGRDRIARDLERQIGDTHARFVAAMTTRFGHMTLEQKERYFAALSALTIRLEDSAKPLRQIAQEAFVEIAPLLVAEIQGGS
jgi:hypothetical protein